MCLEIFSPIVSVSDGSHAGRIDMQIVSFRWHRGKMRFCSFEAFYTRGDSVRCIKPGCNAVYCNLPAILRKRLWLRRGEVEAFPDEASSSRRGYKRHVP